MSSETRRTLEALTQHRLEVEEALDLVEDALAYVRHVLDAAYDFQFGVTDDSAELHSKLHTLSMQLDQVHRELLDVQPNPERITISTEFNTLIKGLEASTSTDPATISAQARSKSLELEEVEASLQSVRTWLQQEQAWASAAPARHRGRQSHRYPTTPMGFLRTVISCTAATILMGGSFYVVNDVIGLNRVTSDFLSCLLILFGMPMWCLVAYLIHKSLFDSPFFS